MHEISVETGDTPWRIAHRLLKDPMRWPELLKYNPSLLRNELVPLPGWTLAVPAAVLGGYVRIAQIIDLLADVRYRNGNDSGWLRAYKEMEIFANDNLRAEKDSEAQVRFRNKDLLILRENSTVLLKVEAGREEVHLMRGEALMRASKTKLVTPSAEVTAKEEKTFYKAGVRPDASTLVQVEEGQTEVKSLATGERVLIPRGFANVTPPNEKPGELVAVPNLPEMQLARQIRLQGGPAAASARVPGSAREEGRPGLAPPSAVPAGQMRPGKAGMASVDPVHFDPKWKRYRLQIASEQEFRHVEREIVREIVPGHWAGENEEDYELPDGAYYRRVSYQNAEGRESPFYFLPALALTGHNPELILEFPEEGYTTRNNLLQVRGKTAPGLILTVNGLPVEVRPDGTFYWAVLLSKKGANRIRVAAKDLKEKQSVLERTVYFEGR